MWYLLGGNVEEEMTNLEFGEGAFEFHASPDLVPSE
jgi:hypothetical protein